MDEQQQWNWYNRMPNANFSGMQDEFGSLHLNQTQEMNHLSSKQFNQQESANNVCDQIAIVNNNNLKKRRRKIHDDEYPWHTPPRLSRLHRQKQKEKHEQMNNNQACLSLFVVDIN